MNEYVTQLPPNVILWDGTGQGRHYLSMLDTHTRNRRSEMEERIPRVAVCAAFYAGAEVVSFVAAFPYRVEFVATCRKDNSPYEERIADICQSHNIDCLRKINVNHSSFINILKEREIDIVLLAWWPDIVKDDAINAAKLGWINVHPSLLPYNRGKHPYFWSVVEQTPFGCSLHFIDRNIDTGDILFQKEIEVSITDTGDTLYAKSVNACIQLFRDYYPRIVKLDFKRMKQDNSIATFHVSSEIEEVSRIDMKKEYLASDLINILRARTFKTGPSAYFFLDNKKYYLRVNIEEAHNDGK